MSEIIKIKNKMSELIEAQQYKTKVYLSMSDFIHGNELTLNEVFIPSYGIAYNKEYDNKFNVFSLKSPREPIDLKTIMIEKSLTDELKDINDLNLLLTKRKQDVMVKAQLYL